MIIFIFVNSKGKKCFLDAFTKYKNLTFMTYHIVKQYLRGTNNWKLRYTCEKFNKLCICKSSDCTNQFKSHYEPFFPV